MSRGPIWPTNCKTPICISGVLRAQLSADRGRDRHSSGLIVVFASLYARMLIFIVVSSPPLIPRPRCIRSRYCGRRPFSRRGVVPKRRMPKFYTPPISPRIFCRVRGSGSGWRGWMMDIAPEAVVPPTRSIAIAPRVAFAKKGAWDGAMNTPASPRVM